MKITAHLEKLRRMDAVRTRLDPVGDFELWFWMSMSGGTHAVNAALHHIGATDPGEYFCTQSVDVYLEQGNTPGTWKHSLRYGCDIIHVGMPEVRAKLPAGLETACEAMTVLEHLRDPCIRGTRAATRAEIDAVEQAYRTCLQLTRRVLETTP